MSSARPLDHDHHRTHPRCALAALCISTSLLLNACAKEPAARVTQVGERDVEIALQGQGSPAVVFESGLGDDLSPWTAVASSIARRTTTLCYSRAGYGQSAASRAPRRDPHTVAAELDELLTSLRIAPPYLLVGHSLGGLYVQAYAADYPQKVAGLVLIDPTHPRQLARAQREAPRDASIVEFMSRLFGAPMRAEFEAYAQLTAFPEPAYKGPVIIMAAGRKQTPSSDAFHTLRGALLREIAAHHPQAQLQWVDASHYIHREQPQAVVNAIEALLD